MPWGPSSPWPSAPSPPFQRPCAKQRTRQHRRTQARAPTGTGMGGRGACGWGWRAYTDLGVLGRLLGHLQRHKRRQRLVQHVAEQGGSVPTQRTRSRRVLCGTRLGATRRPARTARRRRRQRARIDRAGASDKAERVPIHTLNWLRTGDGGGGGCGVGLGRGRVEGSARRRRIGRGKWLVLLAQAGW